MNTNTPTLTQLQQGLRIAEQIEALQVEMAALFNGSVPTPISSANGIVMKKKGGMSAAGRARIAAAQKLRWAKVKKGKAPAEKTPVKKKRNMSPEHRAKLAAAAKARWATKKAGKDPAPTA